MRLISLAILCLGISSQLFTCDDKHKVGDRVVVIADSVNVKSGGEVVDILPRGFTVTVRDVRDEEIGLLVRRFGYIARADVLPLNQAIAYFTELIRAEPQDSTLFHGRALCHKELGEYDEAIID